MPVLDRPFANAARRPAQGAELMLLGSRRGFFGEENLLKLVALVTLLLQAISFITTLQGATLFLGGVFVLAPLFFALAVQSAAWFLAGSLRVRIAPLRCLALGLALCCSTYYSYVGIYNNVNPPAVYLAAEYAQVQNTLAGAYTSRSAAALRTARDQVNQMVSELAGRYSLLQAQQARLAACAGELDAVSAGYTSGLRAPSRGSYANYEDYVAAYNAYLASVTANASAEQTAARAEILTRYGFESESQLAQAAAQAEADLSAFEAAAAALEAAGDAVPAQLESARAGLLSALTAAETTGQLGEQARAGLARLVQLAAAQAESSLTTDGLLAPVDAALAQAGQPLMATFESLESQLPGGRVTSANAQQMKTLMSSEILQAVLRVNDLAQGGQPFAADDAAMQITDLHLKPLLALAQPNSRGMALFCLFLAGLMDGLTLLFSIACRRRRTLLGARSPRRVLAENGQALAAQICACLPAGRDPLDELDAFLSCFCASPATLGRGYNLAAPRQALAPYERLCALLCQLGLAAIEPAGGGEEGETVLLRADLLLFAGELLATRSRDRLAARLDGEAAARRSAKALGQPG